MNETEESLPTQEQQPTHEDLAKLAVTRVETLARDALSKPNSTTMDAYGKFGHPSWKTPINHEVSGGTVGELEVTYRGLSGKPDAIGAFFTHTIGAGDKKRTTEYWIDPRGGALFQITGTTQSILEKDRLSECNPITTKEVLDEYGNVIEGALHPEKVTSQEKLDKIAAQSAGTSKRRGGFLMRLARRIYDPSKVFPKKR